MQSDNLLVGTDTSDDACVYRISDTEALVQTVDFFPPVVDDAYTYGKIAAANALSDVYAMGAKPFLAMNILCFPSCLDVDIAGEILRGGADKVLEAGAIIAGGHSIKDDEPKYGLCVTGRVDLDKILTNANAQIGDMLILTKALGTGILNTAKKADCISDEHYSHAIESMCMLNKSAAEAARDYTVHACTDVTGFGLLGHTAELADAANVSIRIHSSALPILPHTIELAQQGMIPGGAYTNAEFVKDRVQYSARVSSELRDIAADPETSGGLLFCVSAAEAAAMLQSIKVCCPYAAIIGKIEPYCGTSIILE